MTKRLPDWYGGVWILILCLWGAISLYYHTGGSGVRINGAAVSFNRGSDYQLYKVTGDLALQIDQDGTSAFVRYKKMIPPFTFLCGCYQNDGTFLENVRLSGDWLYGAPVEIVDDGGWKKVPRAGVAAVHLKTGETISVAKPQAEALPPELSARGLTAEAPWAKAAELVERLPRLSTSNESCEVFNAAFLILALLLILLLPFFWLRRRA